MKDSNRIKELILTNLGKYYLPHSIKFVESIETTSSGKLKRKIVWSKRKYQVKLSERFLWSWWNSIYKKYCDVENNLRDIASINGFELIKVSSAVYSHLNEYTHASIGRYYQIKDEKIEV